MKILIISGSPRSNGNTVTVIREAARAIKDHGVETNIILLGEMEIHYCLGCKKCYELGRCVQIDDMDLIMKSVFDADILLIASPSYWGDVTGQMKVFIDRCTPYCNTNPNRTPVPSGIKGAAIVLRAGMSTAENTHLLATIEHFLGHLNIPLMFTYTAEGIESTQDLKNKPEWLALAYQFGEKLRNLLFKYYRTGEV